MNTLSMSMVSARLTLTTALLLATCSGVQADQIKGETLVTNCQELIAIYDKKGEQRLMAGMSTSVAEAMRAGICRGMIEEHANHNRCNRNWYAMASYIASQDTYIDVEVMLDNACVK